MKSKISKLFPMFFISLLLFFLLKPNERGLLLEGQRNIPKDKYIGYNTSWIIILTVNDGYLDFLQNWIHFYEKLHLNYRVFVITEDDTAFLKLNNLKLDQAFTVIRSWKKSSSSAVKFESKQFMELTSARPSHIFTYLEKGLNVLYADIDSVWLQDPFPYFTGDFDMWIQLDGNTYCTGLLGIRRSNDSIKLTKMWEASLKQKLNNDQTAFNLVCKEAKIKIKSLDTNLFPSGDLYFNKFDTSKRNSVAIVHNNYIIGHDKKLQRFKKHNLWFPE